MLLILKKILVNTMINSFSI